MGLATIGGSLLVGLSLGLLGAGGAILVVPILVYLAGHPEKSAIAEGLAIVAIIAIYGGVSGVRRGRVDRRAVLVLALPGLAGSQVGAWLSTGVSGSVQLMALACVMIAAAVLMARSSRPGRARPAEERAALLPGVLAGLGVGVLTGFLGIGGGFLVVPALVLLLRTPLERAVPTSLAVIAINAIAGFVGHLGTPIDAVAIALFGGVGILGCVTGGWLSRRIEPRILRRGFALFLVALAIFVILKQSGVIFAAPADSIAARMISHDDDDDCRSGRAPRDGQLRHAGSDA